jgi:uncharacterized protein (DUF885 family)
VRAPLPELVAMRLPLVCAVLLVVGALSPMSAPAAPSADLSKLCDEYWQGYLELNPREATALGDTRWDAKLEDITPDGIAREQKFYEKILDRARAIDPKSLSNADRVTRSSLIEEMEDRLAVLSCHLEEWVVDPQGGPQVDFMNLPDVTVIRSRDSSRNYVKRCQAMGRYLDDTIDNLRAGLTQGKTASRDEVQKTIAELERLIAQPVDSLPIMVVTRAEPPAWSAADRQAFARELRAAAADSLVPALTRYRAFLVSEILPAARPPGKAGLAALPGGTECYAKLIRAHTSLSLSAKEIHQLGLEQVAAFRTDLAKLGQKVFGTSDIAAIQNKLRSDPAMHFATAAQVEDKARETLARAQAAVPRWFGKRQPARPCEVVVMGMHEAPYATIAYYREPSADGTRPGQYVINTYQPETRPRYEAEALAFHESVPGHHLQIAVAQELKGVPEFRKHQGVTAFVEGWGLYAERLADQMGLYSSDMDRIGMLSFDAWRSCRLVVDTGLHDMGWSRQQAIDYMVENTCLAENNIENEVDRYITWPGQALAYKLGQLEILRLREEAQRRLGSRFDIKAFHDAVLGNGAVALPVLREQVEAYIRAAGGTP